MRRRAICRGGRTVRSKRRAHGMKCMNSLPSSGAFHTSQGSSSESQATARYVESGENDRKSPTNWTDGRTGCDRLSRALAQFSASQYRHLSPIIPRRCKPLVRRDRKRDKLRLRFGLHLYRSTNEPDSSSRLVRTRPTMPQSGTIAAQNTPWGISQIPRLQTNLSRSSQARPSTRYATFPMSSPDATHRPSVEKLATNESSLRVSAIRPDLRARFPTARFGQFHPRTRCNAHSIGEYVTEAIELLWPVH